MTIDTYPLGTAAAVAGIDVELAVGVDQTLPECCRSDDEGNSWSVQQTDDGIQRSDGNCPN